MSDITAKTMVTGFKRLPQRAYLGGYTSYFGSRTHFQLATFYALTETPDIVCMYVCMYYVLERKSKKERKRKFNDLSHNC